MQDSNRVSRLTTYIIENYSALFQVHFSITFSQLIIFQDEAPAVPQPQPRAEIKRSTTLDLREALKELKVISKTVFSSNNQAAEDKNKDLESRLMEETGSRSVLEIYISNLRQQLEDEQQAKVNH
jgi:hypothetical protein